MIARIRAKFERTDDDGFTLIAVMGTMAVLTALLLAAMGYAVANAKPSRTDEDAKTALAAAQAGVDDYLAHLNSQPTYFVNNNIDLLNPALNGGETVPGTGSSGASYSYKVVSTVAQTQQTGIVKLLSTGKSRSVTRSVTALLQPGGFLRFIYFTDLETTDPSLYDTSITGSYACGRSTCTEAVPASEVDSDCGRYYYNGRAGSQTWTDTSGHVISYSCSEIQFTGHDTINGPLHSNDALQIGGSVLFTGKAETGYQVGSTPAPSSASHLWWGTGSPSSSGNLPSYAPNIPLPSSNSQLKPTAQTSAGCYYTGATRITFAGTQMKVLSPLSTTALTSAACLNKANASSEQTVAIPSVIYVDDASIGTCGTKNAMGYPLTNEDTTDISPDYTCTKGTAYVSGSLSGKTTISTASDIVVTANLTYASATNGTDVTNVTDTLGLIATNSVWVYHPVNKSGANMLSASQAVTQIDAAMMSLNHSFIVQNYDEGTAVSNAGDTTTSLNVLGAIIQKYRGPVGTGNGTTASTGYLKNYVFDPRLENVPPPYFLRPDSSPWGVTQLSDG